MHKPHAGRCAFAVLALATVVGDERFFDDHGACKHGTLRIWRQHTDLWRSDGNGTVAGA